MSDSALTVTHVRNEIQKSLINYYTKTQIYPKKKTNNNNNSWIKSKSPGFWPDHQTTQKIKKDLRLESIPAERQPTKYSHIHNYSQIIVTNQPNMQVFALWEEGEVRMEKRSPYKGPRVDCLK